MFMIFYVSDRYRPLLIAMFGVLLLTGLCLFTLW
jgi:hypothetical protein